ncbi:hypothetical protein ACTFIY_004188 [Dictyostelium cf. discoideum]
MATIFDILNTLNNNNYFENCKRQCPINKTNKTIIDILPPMDVTMTNDKLIIEAELAGISKDDIEIDIKDSILTIQGEKKNNLNKQQQQQQQQQQLVIEKSTSSSTLDTKEDEPSIEEFEDDIKPKSKSDNTNATTTTATTTTTTKENKEDENKTKSIDKKFISERTFGNFKRYLDLTKVLYQLDLNSINTQFENGLLTITINKKLHYSNTIKININ